MVAFRKLIVGVVVACFLLSYVPGAWAHGGGLNREGCHRETATGGYHCHRGSADDDKEESQELLIGVGAAVAALALWWLLTRENNTSMSMVPQDPEPERSNPLIPTPYVVGDQDGAAQVGAVWKIDF